MHACSWDALSQTDCGKHTSAEISYWKLLQSDFSACVYDDVQDSWSGFLEIHQETLGASLVFDREGWTSCNACGLR